MPFVSPTGAAAPTAPAESRAMEEMRREVARAREALTRAESRAVEAVERAGRRAKDAEDRAAAAEARLAALRAEGEQLCLRRAQLYSRRRAQRIVVQKEKNFMRRATRAKVTRRAEGRWEERQRLAAAKAKELSDMPSTKQAEESSATRPGLQEPAREAASVVPQGQSAPATRACVRAPKGILCGPDGSR